MTHFMNQESFHFIIIIWKLLSNPDTHFSQNLYNYINSLVPFITIILVYYTFKAQKEQVEGMRKQLTFAENEVINNKRKELLTRIDQHFLMCLTIHRDNVNAMRFAGKTVGKYFFVEAMEKFENVYSNVFKHQYQISANGLGLTELQLIDITYRIIFYGNEGERSERQLKSQLKKYSSLLPLSIEDFIEAMAPTLCISEQGLQSNL